MGDKCRGCDEDVKWIETKAGKKTLVNIPPEKRYQVKEGIGELIDTYMPHWATCEHAAEFRKSKKSFKGSGG